LEATRTAEGNSVMAFLNKIAERLKQIKNKSTPQQVKEAAKAFREALADPEAFSENLDDLTIDALLDRSLTKLEEAQANLETQLFELQAIGTELNQLLNKKTTLS
jgi:bacterioferritin (cytochrome b1)